MESILPEGSKKLGFGCMRLPMENEKIDMAEMIRMVDAYLDAGFCYFDTAFGYHGGASETSLKEALVARYPRERFLLADKMPVWRVGQGEKTEDLFATQLERTGAGYFDLYLLHALSKESNVTAEKHGVWEYLTAQKTAGKIRHLGFSFHDTAAVLDDILTRHPEAEFVQLQLNYFDWESESVQSRLCYETAQQHKKPVIVMEPVRGGSLAVLPEKVRQNFLAASKEASMASWALRFAASLPGVMMVLSGMSKKEQMTDNLKTFSDFLPLTQTERELCFSAAKQLREIPTIPCTGCAYCTEDCPQSIAIPKILRALNNYATFGNLDTAKQNYRMAVKDKGAASDCIGCGACSARCPQHIAVPEKMQQAALLFE